MNKTNSFLINLNSIYFLVKLDSYFFLFSRLFALFEFGIIHEFVANIYYYPLQKTKTKNCLICLFIRQLIYNILFQTSSKN